MESARISPSPVRVVEVMSGGGGGWGGGTEQEMP